MAKNKFSGPHYIQQMFKKLYLFIACIVFLQTIDFLVWGYFGYSLNIHMIFGLAGSNLFSAMVSIVLLLALSFFINRKKYSHTLLYVIVCAATISNILDRIFYGGVVDYIELYFIPTFNLADLIIVLSMAGLFSQLFFEDNKKTSD